MLTNKKRTGKSTFKYPILRKEMQIQGYTIKSMATRVGISENSLRNKLDGSTRFYIDEAKLISRLLDKDINNVFKDEL